MDIKVNKTSVIVFDLDDTLYNETEYLRSAYIEIAKSVERKDWKSLLARMLSQYRSAEDVFGFITENYGISKQELLSRYRNHDPTIRPFEGVHDIFQGIKDKNGRIGIITDGRSSTQRKKLETLGLTEFIDKIVISEETGSEKPEETNFILMQEAFANSTYYYVADNIRKDFIAPNRLGWKTIGLIDNGLNIHHDGYLHFDASKVPHDFVLSFQEIHIG